MKREVLDTYYECLSAKLGDVLITPTKIYVKALKSLKDGSVTVKACSHITGGGFYENIPRMLKKVLLPQLRKIHTLYRLFLKC